MYVYRITGKDLFTVGFYKPITITVGYPNYNVSHSFKWVVESDHPTKEEAAAHVNYLNGGLPLKNLATATQLRLLADLCDIETPKTLEQKGEI